MPGILLQEDIKLTFILKVELYKVCVFMDQSLSSQRKVVDSETQGNVDLDKHFQDILLSRHYLKILWV